MEYAKDLNIAVDEAVWGDEGKLGQNQFSDVWHLRGSAQACKRFQLLKGLDDLSDHRIGGDSP